MVHHVSEPQLEHDVIVEKDLTDTEDEGSQMSTVAAATRKRRHEGDDDGGIASSKAGGKARALTECEDTDIEDFDEMPPGF